ncbi:hypothetical protein Taro_031860 [Colocasia esculenta]|uniref:Uncharacterized protein n=1 Tax=Colocasia esculenta TaxID=4460 RepID=A0A843VVR0_COLES|nr:hypothetical protein [Colocasia esculenta]
MAWLGVAQCNFFAQAGVFWAEWRVSAMGGGIPAGVPSPAEVFSGTGVEADGEPAEVPMREG